LLSNFAASHFNLRPSVKGDRRALGAGVDLKVRTDEQNNSSMHAIVLPPLTQESGVQIEVDDVAGVTNNSTIYAIMIPPSTQEMGIKIGVNDVARVIGQSLP
jgi:hypothetical protein